MFSQLLSELRFLRTYGDIKIAFTKKVPVFVNRVFRNKFSRNKHHPPSIQLEPTNICNLNCITCSREKVTRNKGFMDFGLFKKIIDEASEIGVSRIHLYHHGEPLLHPKIIDMIRYIKSNNLSLTFSSNGMLLSETISKQLLFSGFDSGDYFRISILGLSKEIHERIMLNVNHETVFSNVERFMELRNLNSLNAPIVQVMFYRHPFNEHEEKRFHEFWNRKVDYVFHGGDISTQYADYKGEYVKPTRTKTCKNIWERLTVLWDGRVTQCIADLDGDYCFGNLNDSTIQEAWNCESINAIRQCHIEKTFNLLPLCSKCDWI